MENASRDCLSSDIHRLYNSRDCSMNQRYDREPARLRTKWLQPPPTTIATNDKTSDGAPPAPLDQTSALVGHMLKENDYLIARAVTDTIKTNEQAIHLVRCLDDNGCILQFLAYIVRDELRHCTQPQLVFRRNSGRSRVVTAFLRLSGHALFGDVLAPVVQAVVAMPPLDIDQNRQPGFGSAQIQGNANGLEGLCNDLIERMAALVSIFPSSIRHFSAMLHREVEQRFPMCGQDAIITVFFLRYICPAIVSPWAFNVCDQQLHPLHGR